VLSRNQKGYFLMVEWDLHTDDVKRGLDRTVVIDKVIREAVEKAGPRAPRGRPLVLPATAMLLCGSA